MGVFTSVGSPGKFYIGKKVHEMQTSPYWGKITKVILNVNESEGYVSGNDTGLTLQADCPWATQAIADSVLASVQDVEYRPYTAAKAIIDPSAELGDAITADGIYSGIYTMSRTMSHLAAIDISSPCDTEVKHEFQYESQENRKFTRRMKEINAEFAIMAGEISAKVSQVGGDNSSFGWVMNETGMYWYANGTEVMRANQSGLEIQGTLKSGSIITGTLNVGGSNIDASILRTGANDGYNWSNGGYGGYPSMASYSLNGSGYGFNFNNASQYNQNVGNYFNSYDLWVHNSLTLWGYEVFLERIGSTNNYYVKASR